VKPPPWSAGQNGCRGGRSGGRWRRVKTGIDADEDERSGFFGDQIRDRLVARGKELGFGRFFRGRAISDAYGGVCP